MSFRLVPKSVILNDLNGVMALALRYFTEFGKPALQESIVFYFLVRVKAYNVVVKKVHVRYLIS